MRRGFAILESNPLSSYLTISVLLISITAFIFGANAPTRARVAQAAPDQQQSGTVCQQIIYNGGMDQGYGWDEYFPVVQIEETPGLPHSPPSAMRMIENDDGAKPPLSGDSDIFGQSFAYPIQGMTSVVIEYQLKYQSIGSSDRVHHALYEVDPSTGNLIGLPRHVFTNTTYLDGQWHLIVDTIPYSSSIQGYLSGKQAALVFYTFTDDNPLYLDVLIDDVQLKICQGSSPPTGSISGVISQNAGSVSGAQLELNLKSSLSSTTMIDEVTAETNGFFQFRNVPPLAAGDTYQVQFVNDDASSERLSTWNGSSITSFPAGHTDPNNNFDITNIQLISPTHEAEATFPVRFTWNGRGVSGDRYELCISDLHTLKESCPKTDLTVTEATIVEADLSPNFGFEYGERYAWYVRVRNGSGSGSDDYGESFFANAITFAYNPNAPPGNGPPPSGSPPPGNGGADWIVMVYIAGDNNLGDPRRYLDPTLNLHGQFASLKQLAVNHPNVNLVTLTDFYDDNGTSYCHLKSDGSQDCQQLGEQDTSDPLVLSSFISNTLASFPANHTMLIISDHGHSIAGVAADETTSRTAVMSPDEIRLAYEAANLDASKLDILFYNACLMGSFEAAYDASSFADYLVASAGEMWVLNIYDRLLPLLSDAATKDNPSAVASGIVTAYKESVQDIAPSYFISSAAFDLSQVPAVNTALSNLASTLADELSANQVSLESIRNQVQVYDSSGNFELGDEDAFVDLKDLAGILTRRGNSNSITTSASALSSTLASLVIAEEHLSGENGQGAGHDLSQASGLSVYFPNGQIAGEQPTLTNLYLNNGIYQQYLNQTEWDEFLRLFLSGALNGGPGRLESATRPVGGALPYNGKTYLPMIRAQN